MVSTNDIRPGQSLIIDGTIYLILEYQHVKPGKGKAFVKTKLKNLSDGGVVDKTFRADENVEQAFIDKQSFNYLYKDNNDYVFMNNETYEQINLNEMIIEDKYLFMKENQEIFFDSGFVEKLNADHTKTLLCFKNGVYDFEKQEFIDWLSNYN